MAEFRCGNFVRGIVLFLGLIGGAVAQERELVIGTVLPLSGPVSAVGVPFAQATRAYIAQVNAKGGVGGYKLRLIERDDGFKPDKTVEGVKAILQEARPIAFVNIIGAPNNGDLVAQGILESHRIPVVGAATAASSVRNLHSPYLFFVRAGVADEAYKIVHQLHTVGIERFGLFHANDAFGKDGLTQVQQALSERKLALLKVASYEPASVDVKDAVSKLRSDDLQAIIVFGTGAASSKFVETYRKAGGGALIVASSATSVDVLVKNVGPEAARGTILAQVLPAVSKGVPLVREYLSTMQQYGAEGWKPSSYGMEGFVAAKVLVEGLRRAGAKPTRESLINALSNMKDVDLGGYPIAFGKSKREGSTYVDIGIVGPNGTLIN
jgi:ABC-type branched-subunit amino acid transport system substrate-binding protein